MCLKIALYSFFGQPEFCLIFILLSNNNDFQTVVLLKMFPSSLSIEEFDLELPLHFFKNQKKCADFAKKGPDCVHPLVKFIIQNVVFRVSTRKNSEIFPAGLFFIEFLTKCLSKCPNFTKPPLPWKISGCASIQILVIHLSFYIQNFKLKAEVIID